MSQTTPTKAEATKYAQEFILHGDKTKAFKAVFKKSKAKGKTLNEYASRFHKIGKVLARIEDLQETLNDKVEAEALYSIEQAFRELEEARGLAIETKQANAAVSASMGKAKIAGLLVDKVDQNVSGSFVIASQPLSAEEWLEQTKR